MKFVFLKITEDHQAGYASERLNLIASRARGGNKNVPESAIEDAIGQLQLPEPPITQEKEFYQTNRKQNAIIKASKLCALETLTVWSPLLEGEEIVEDFFSYLKEPYADCPKQTAILKRTTNKAQILYLFEDIQINNGDIVKLKSEDPSRHKPRQLEDAKESSNTEKIIQLLLKKASSTIADKVGAFVLNLVMESVFGKQDDTDKLIQEIQRVAKEEIEANELARVEGTLSGTIQYLNNEYKPMKEKLDLTNRAAREKLTNMLKYYNEKFYTDVLGLLQTDKYAGKGLKLFFIASSMHLIISQELALADPESHNPNESSYLVTLTENAKKYANFAKSEYDQVISNRTNKIRLVVDNWTDCTGNTCVHKTFYYWSDEENNTQSNRYENLKGDDRPAADRARDDMNDHINAVLTELRTGLGNPDINYFPEIKNLFFYKFSSI
jgi:hypothetical protein